MEKKLQNKVIVIGGNHHNGLGVIRSLGERGAKVYLIVNTTSKSFISKSKYIINSWGIEEEEGILEILLKEFNNEQFKPIIIPTADFAANLIDKNFNKLKEKYILPNAEEKEGQIACLMNKSIMNKIASDSGLKVPKYWSVNLDGEADILPKDMMYPCIVKPLLSVEGKRQDIVICHHKKELISKLKYMSKDYKRVLIQQYIEKKGELGILGCVTQRGKEIIAPGIIKKYREYPLNSGSSSYASVYNNPEDYLEQKPIYNFLKNLRYTGIFDMEFLYDKKDIYFIEINFRNGGNGYSLTKAGINIIYLWCLEAAEIDITSESRVISEKTNFMMDTRDFRHVINGDLSIGKWIRDLLNTKAFLVFNFKDMKPFIFKFLYH